MKLVCEQDMCTGCMACVDSCPKNAIILKDSLSSYNAIINEKLCIGCGICNNVCQKNNEVELLNPILWYQGWSFDDNLRTRAASGGIITSIAKKFILEGGLVTACSFYKGEFSYKIINNVKDLKYIAGSKYVKSDPKDIYNKVKELLKNNNKVLFVGLPCHVAALKKIIGENDYLYTIDIVCHGTPSPLLLEIFLGQYNISINDVNDIKFRSKNRYNVIVDDRYIDLKGVCDYYSLAFVNSIISTNNCYSCDYAKLQRGSDLTVGDSWGSCLNKSEKEKGISLILIQTEKGNKLIENADLYICDVNLDDAVNSNRQLKSPSKKPDNRNDFFKQISNGISFNKAVENCLPWVSFKQRIKRILIKTENKFNGETN